MITSLLKLIYKFENYLIETIPVKQPLNKIIVASIATLSVLMSVIIIGALIERIKRFEYKSLADASGNKLANFIVYRLTFPGTIIHEFSHAMFAFIAGAKVTKIQCFSTKKNTLGYVTYQSRGSKIQQGFQHSITACAPVVSGLILIPIFVSLMLQSNDTMLKILFGYLAVSIVNHMNMSNLDIKQYIKGIPVLFLITFTASYISLLTIK